MVPEQGCLRFAGKTYERTRKRNQRTERIRRRSQSGSCGDEGKRKARSLDQIRLAYRRDRGGNRRRGGAVERQVRQQFANEPGTSLGSMVVLPGQIHQAASGRDNACATQALSRPEDRKS